MKGLSLSQPYASLVALGLKTLETRKMRIHYRGPLVICSTKTLDASAWNTICHLDSAPLSEILMHERVDGPVDLPRGQALALVDVVGCRPLVEADWPESFFYAEKRFAWKLANVRRLSPFPVRGMNGLFPVDEEKVRIALGVAQLEAARAFRNEATQ